MLDTLGYNADQSIDDFMDSSINYPTLHKEPVIEDPMTDYAMESLQGSVPNMAAYDVYSAFGTEGDASGDF